MTSVGRSWDVGFKKKLNYCCEQVVAHDVTKYHAPKPRQAEPWLVHIGAAVSSQSITTCVCANLSNKYISQYRVLLRVQQHTTTRLVRFWNGPNVRLLNGPVLKCFSLFGQKSPVFKWHFASVDPNHRFGVCGPKPFKIWTCNLSCIQMNPLLASYGCFFTEVQEGLKFRLEVCPLRLLVACKLLTSLLVFCPA